MKYFYRKSEKWLPYPQDPLLKSTGILNILVLQYFVLVLGAVTIFSIIFAGANIFYHSVQDLLFLLFTLIMSVTISSATSQSLKASILSGFCLPMRLPGILPSQNTVIES